MTPRHAVAALLVSVAVATLAACAGTTATAPGTSAIATTAPAAQSATPSESPSGSTASTATEAATEASAGDADCTPGDSLVEQTEGPYYVAGAPERTDITDGAPGTPMALAGYVLDSQCNAVPGATVEFWQADGNGNYDNSGFVFRGVQTTGADGSYTLTTVIPGQYPGRTEHIHVKVTPAGGSTYTTQLYLPDSPTNEQDRIYVAGMEIDVISYDGAAMDASFDLVVPS